MIRAVRTIATVGVYSWTLDEWLEALHRADARLVVDVRQRRGVRGSEYAWANAKRLEAALTAAGIGYEHRQELAPTTELRQVQYREDDRVGVGKRSRVGLAPEYVERYEREILGQTELRPIVESLPADGASVLMCVERDPEACHRSLVAARLASEFGLPVTHLTPS
jgi:uncharacterized protein (DUF488 family)